MLLPAVFVSHGAPTIALEPGATGAFFRSLGAAIDRRFGRPQAIVAVSAHTAVAEGPPVWLAAPQHTTVHDFGGFAPALYALRYDAPGAPELAARGQAALAQAGIASTLERQGGLDHGIWTALMHVWPQADVPVLPLAWPLLASAADLFALGRALAPLRAQGVLVLGTGSITHNLRLVFDGGLVERAGQTEHAASAGFRNWIHDRATQGDWPALFDWRRQAPHATLMHPGDEHLLPWFVAAGAGADGTPPCRLHEGYTFGALGMDAYAFGAAATELAADLAAEPASAPTTEPSP
jgi:4,5-DOPA dioxygenase extradiol